MNDGIHNLSPMLRQLVENELDPGERVLWSAQPLRGTFVRTSIPFALFGVIWVGMVAPGFLHVWSSPESPNAVEFGARFLMIPFLLVGVVMLSAPLWALKQAKNTVYVLTDRRALSFSKTLRNIAIKSFLPHQLRNLKRIQRNDGSGDIIIEQETVYYKGRPRPRTVGFKGVPHVKQVEDMLETLAKADVGRR